MPFRRLDLVVDPVVQLREETLLEREVVLEAAGQGELGRELRVELRRVPDLEVRPAVEIAHEHDEKHDRTAHHPVEQRTNGSAKRSGDGACHEVAGRHVVPPRSSCRVPSIVHQAKRALALFGQTERQPGAQGFAIPSFFIRDRRVLGFRPRRLAALPSPLTFQSRFFECAQDVGALDGLKFIF